MDNSIIMNNMHRCITYKPCTDCVVVTCKLGLWEIKGPYDVTTAKKIEVAYKQSRDVGKYIKLLVKENKDVRAIGTKSKR